MYRRDWSDPLSEMAAKLQLDASAAPVDEEVQITVEDAKRCPRYTARVIRGCKVGPSPDWMVERLAAIGQRSVNNVVDVTNYILFLFGQPLHAFDLNKVKNAEGVAHIVVRAAEDGEKLTTLDGEHRKLTSDMTMAMGATTLADVKDVIVGARISRTGNFMPQAGDLEGETSAPVQTGTEGIDLVIGTVR